MVVIESGPMPGEIVRASDWDTAWAVGQESVTVTWTVNGPFCVGVPEISPLGESVRPEGRPPVVVQVNAPKPPLA